MEIHHFVQTIIQRPQDLRGYPLIQVVSDSIPFFLLNAIRVQWSNKGLALHSIDIADQDIGATIARLTTSFLGGSQIYWLNGHDVAFSSKKSKAFIEFLREYSGPHTLIFFTKKANKISTQGVTIVLEGQGKKALSQEFARLLGVSPFSKILSHLTKTTSVNETCMLLYYSALAGEQYYTSDWTPRLISRSPSLFTLSQFFFAKEPQKFFTLWSQVQHYYVPQFWVSFWSDQLWRAYFYIRCMRAGQNGDAKQFSYRLPFSFLNKDWRVYSSEAELSSAHQFLYESDYLSKNGVTSSGLELLYSKFFLDQFCP